MPEMIDELARVESEVFPFGEAQEWLDSRWAEMSTCPPVPLMTGNYGEQHTVKEVANFLMGTTIDGGEAAEGGGVNGRRDSCPQIVQGLVDSKHPILDDWFSRMGRLHLFRL